MLDNNKMFTEEFLQIANYPQNGNISVVQKILAKLYSTISMRSVTNKMLLENTATEKQYLHLSSFSLCRTCFASHTCCASLVACER